MPKLTVASPFSRASTVARALGEVELVWWSSSSSIYASITR